MNNETLIKDLRNLADYLEAHPEFPQMDHFLLWADVYEVEKFRTAAQNMGAVTKKFDDYRVHLEKHFGMIKVSVEISRDKVCKKIITWDCPDDPLLAPLLSEAQEE